ncbi:hypothetical protein [Nannocystis punicea]|uniref:EF-hand domain-containing protein n=1 Tax=Nannocystis punicea TaxID=2995304 RepID=A0ABY7H6D4_9BACT|nr:hypothetical protein [Nannocystis poenicansa]WAS94615.1 hypothetical protein O0S08_00510 [Nannocystis poenicansa]
MNGEKRMHRDAFIEDALRARAGQGASVVALVEWLRAELGVTDPGQGRFMVMRHLARAFAIPAREVSAVGAWVGFGDGDGEITDEELNALLGAYLR